MCFVKATSCFVLRHGVRIPQPPPHEVGGAKPNNIACRITKIDRTSGRIKSTSRSMGTPAWRNCSLHAGRSSGFAANATCPAPVVPWEGTSLPGTPLLRGSKTSRTPPPHRKATTKALRLQYLQPKRFVIKPFRAAKSSAYKTVSKIRVGCIAGIPTRRGTFGADELQAILGGTPICAGDHGPAVAERQFGGMYPPVYSTFLRTCE